MNIEQTTQSEEWDEYARRMAPDNLYYRWVWRDSIQETSGTSPIT